MRAGRPCMTYFCDSIAGTCLLELRRGVSLVKENLDEYIDMVNSEDIRGDGEAHEHVGKGLCD